MFYIKCNYLHTCYLTRFAVPGQRYTMPFFLLQARIWVDILREAAAHSKWEGERVGSISMKSSITQLHVSQQRWVGLKFIQFFLAFSPHGFRHTTSSLHQPFSFSQILQPPASPITPHLDTHSKKWWRDKNEKINISQDKDPGKQHLSELARKTQLHLHRTEQTCSNILLRPPVTTRQLWYAA